VQIFRRKSRTHRTLGSHQIWFFRRRSEQLVGREARREHKEALAHVLGAEDSPEAAPTVNKHRLRCHSPPIKVRINTFPSSLWSRRSKPYRKPTIVARENSNFGEPPRSAATCCYEREPTLPRPEPDASAIESALGDSCIGCEEPMATQHQIGCEEPMATQHQIGSKHLSRDTDSIGLIRVIDLVANGQRLMKSVDPWAGAGGPIPRCCGHILRIFLKENNSINP
jgi:hypothetical protein